MSPIAAYDHARTNAAADAQDAAPHVRTYDWTIMFCEFPHPTIREYWAIAQTADGEAECWLATYELQRNGEWTIAPQNGSACDFDMDVAEPVGRLNDLYASEIEKAGKAFVENL